MSQTASPLKKVPWKISIPQGGLRDGVKLVVQSAAAHLGGKTEGIDQAQIESAKKLILERIDSLPALFNGCIVNAQGHSSVAGERFQFAVDGQHLAVVPPKK